MNKTAAMTIRACFGALLLGLLLWLVGPASLVEQLQNVSGGYLALAFAAQAVNKILWAMRWQEILRVGGIDQKLIDLTGLVLVGQFFNNFLPSSMGGDVVRGYYSAGDRGSLSAAYGAVVAERLVGFGALAAVCAAAVFGSSVAGSSLLPPALVAVALVVCACIVMCCGVMFLTTGWSDLLLRLLRGQTRLISVVTELSKAMQFMRQPGCRVWRVVYLSVVIQIAAILFFLFAARAVGVTIDAVSFFVVVPLAVIASMVPISLNGLGLREGALVGLLQLFGVAAPVAGAFAVLARLVDFVVAALGGIVFAFQRSWLREPAKVERQS
jgi:glycosyltransferase 2 family protein